MAKNLIRARSVSRIFDMQHIFRFLAIFLALPVLLHAELPPSAYESMQAKAPEYLKIEVLRVSVEPGEEANQQKIELVALVKEVNRTATDVKPGDMINITYTVTEHPKGWAGPGAIPVPMEREQMVAYLIKSETGDFNPAAGRMSFSNF